MLSSEAETNLRRKEGREGGGGRGGGGGGEGTLLAGFSQPAIIAIKGGQKGYPNASFQQMRLAIGRTSSQQKVNYQTKQQSEPRGAQ